MIETAVSIPAGNQKLDGNLTIPKDATAIVLFAHGSGSNRASPRNQKVSAVLHDSGFGTLLFDLLTPAEARDRDNVFAIDLLARRLIAATAWCRAQPDTARLPQGYFGASTGAAAALKAAAAEPTILAVVSRGGRPDLADNALSGVRAPTLLIVGGEDAPVVAMNEQALKALTCVKSLVTVPHATHLFEEPGALDEVARLAASWFVKYLRAN
jgi:putative phosphoribosyl transferase